MGKTSILCMLVVTSAAVSTAVPEPVEPVLCAEVRSVLKQTETGFKDLRGAPDPVISDADTRYWIANLTWEGASECQVAEESDVTEFICTWRADTAEAVNTRFKQLHRDLSICLGPMETKPLESKSGLPFLRLTYSADVNFRLAAHPGDSSPRTTLTIAAWR